MTLKVGINGYGRIGRNVLRALYESGKRSQLQIVAINDLGDAKINAHLTRYDTRARPLRRRGQGRWRCADGQRRSHQGAVGARSGASCPGASLGVDIVLECTGLFTSKAKAGKHLEGGAKKVRDLGARRR